MPSCTTVPPKGRAGCVNAHVRICAGGPGQPGSLPRSGVKAELGLPVCYHQHQFILHHQVLHEGVDSDMIVPFVEEAQRRYPALDSISTDRGYWSPGNRARLESMLNPYRSP